MRQYVLDLPFPCSTNAMYRHIARGVSRSDKYWEFINDADAALLMQKQKQGLQKPPLLSKCWINIVLNEDQENRRDPDNVVKTLFDWLKRCKIVKDDKGIHIRKFTVEWGKVLSGCRVTISEVE